jgi:hypothetical protein
MKRTIHDFFKPTRPYGTITESVMDQFSIINYKIGVKYTEQDTVSLLRSPVNSSYARGSINSSEADYIKPIGRQKSSPD